jgi:Tetratricopeptide repeat
VHGVAASLHNLGSIALEQEDWGRAAAHFRESLALFGAAGDRINVGECLVGLALVAAAIGQTTGAARLIGAAEGLGGWRVEEDDEYRATVSEVRSRLGAAAYAAAEAAGSTFSIAEASAEAALVGPDLKGSG